MWFSFLNGAGDLFMRFFVTGGTTIHKQWVGGWGEIEMPFSVTLSAKWACPKQEYRHTRDTTESRIGGDRVRLREGFVFLDIWIGYTFPPMLLLLQP